jgi:two-component system response regulator
MDNERSNPGLLVAEDSQEDRVLLRAALKDAKISVPLEFAADGQDLLEQLRACEVLPGLVMMDLNMPRMNGRECLKAMRAEPRLAVVPVVILSTSSNRQDVVDCYDLGANSFVVKPFDYGEFVKLVGGLCLYWFQTVELPARHVDQF